MDKIVRLDGADLHTFLADMASMTGPNSRAVCLHVTLDEGGFKWKVNGYTWSPARGVEEKTSIDWRTIAARLAYHGMAVFERFNRDERDALQIAVTEYLIRRDHEE